MPCDAAHCPSSARHFDDFNDPTTNVSRLVTERAAIDLNAGDGEQAPSTSTCRLRPKTNSAPRTDPGRPGQAACQPDTPRARTAFLGWLDAALDRLG